MRSSCCALTLQFVYLLNPATVSAAGRYEVTLQGVFIAGLQVQP
jgi:hypothetical protein